MANTRAVFQLGMDLDSRPITGAPRKAQEEVVTTGTGTDAGQRNSAADAGKDHWVVRNGTCYAGRHLIIDLWGAERLDDLAHVERTLVEAVEAAGATLLHLHLHHFTPNGGISGVAVLAESHISIHSWPEKGYAALDVFMCGDAEPEKTVPVLRRAFRPHRIELGELRRGEGGGAERAGTTGAGRAERAA